MTEISKRKKTMDSPQSPQSPQSVNTDELSSNRETKITDVNNHCLEEIFQYLDLDDLFNIAVANKSLSTSAAAIYGRKFGHKPVNVCSIRHCPQCLYLFGDYICVDSLQYSLAFLRCFGAYVPALVLFCRRAFSSANDTLLDRYVNQYCADTLTRLHFTGTPTISNAALEKPFIKMDSVDFFISNFGYEMRTIVEWFPNLRYLKIVASSVNYATISAHLPHLKRLRIPIENNGWNHVTNLIQMNPQLQWLEIDMAEDVDKTTDNLLDMIVGNAAIRKLSIQSDDDSFVTVNTAEVQRFIVEHPEMVEINLPKYVFQFNDVLDVIGQMNALQEFQFQINDRSDYTQLTSRLNHGWQHELKYVRHQITGRQHFLIKLSR